MKAKSTPPLGTPFDAVAPRAAQAGAQAEAFGHAIGDTLRALSGLSLAPAALSELQGEYLKQATTAE